MTMEKEFQKAIQIAKKHRVGKLYLVGSALYSGKTPPRDYDFAVADMPSGVFFKFYGELLLAMSKRVDLIDLSGKMTKFKKLVLQEAKLLYDKSAA